MALNEMPALGLRLRGAVALAAVVGGCQTPRGLHSETSSTPTAVAQPFESSTTTSPSPSAGEGDVDRATQTPNEQKPLTDRHGNPIPEQYACTVEVLEWLAKNFAAIASPNLDANLRPNLAELTAHLANSVRFVDDDFTSSAGGGGTRPHATDPQLKATLQPRQIELQLNARKGIAFFRLTNLGRAYSLTHPNHSKLSFRSLNDRVIVDVGVKSYELTFELGADCRLEEVHYLIVEAE